MSCRQRRPSLIVWRRPGGPSCGARMVTPMLTVAADRDLVERQLAGGLLVCPECGTGGLGGHGWVSSRWLRRADGRGGLLKAHATGQEEASGTVAGGVRPGGGQGPGWGGARWPRRSRRSARRPRRWGGCWGRRWPRCRRGRSRRRCRTAACWRSARRRGCSPRPGIWSLPCDRGEAGAFRFRPLRPLRWEALVGYDEELAAPASPARDVAVFRYGVMRAAADPGPA